MHPPLFCAAPRRRRVAAVVSTAVVAALSLAGCSAMTGSASPAGQTIVLYSAQHAQTTDALVAAFEKRTGIHVKVDNNDEDVLTAQIEQEGTRSPADVFYTENSNWLQQLADRRLLAKIDAATLSSVPTADSAGDGEWVGVSARVSCLVYDPARISASALPTSILDMAEPRYKGMFEIAPAETDFWPVVASVAAAKGDAATVRWLTSLKADAADDNVPDNETLTADVAQGTTDFAVIDHYYYYRLQAESADGTGHAKLAYFTPRDPGSVESISGAAVLKSSRHAAAAQKFVAFLTSAAGQQVLESGQSFEYPLRTGVAANPMLPPLTTYRPAAFSPALLGTGETAKTLLQRAGLL